MQIRIGYELVYECPQPTPMLLMLTVHHTRAADLVAADWMIADPQIPIHAYRDGFGNWCTRIVAPAGRLRLSASGIVNDTGEPEGVPSLARQHPVEELPDEALVFLLPTRYCETDRLFGDRLVVIRYDAAGLGRVKAILDYVHQHVAFGYEHARNSRTA